MFLLSAALDNIPDGPELLGSTSGSATVSLLHHASSKDLDRVGTTWDALKQPEICTQYMADALLVLSPPGITRSLNQAADPSPPTA
jgi:hypothetical protein